MRQIDNMTPSELDVLRLKNMLPDRGLSEAKGDKSPFAPLHPTLKKCKCHYIGTKRELYKHFDDVRRRMKVFGESAREFFAGHGEVPLRCDDPKLNVEQQLSKSLAMHVLQSELYNDPEVRDTVDDILLQYQIPSGHRLDDNNTETPTK